MIKTQDVIYALISELYKIRPDIENTLIQNEKAKSNSFFHYINLIYPKDLNRHIEMMTLDCHFVYLNDSVTNDTTPTEENIKVFEDLHRFLSSGRLLVGGTFVYFKYSAKKVDELLNFYLTFTYFLSKEDYYSEEEAQEFMQKIYINKEKI